MFATIPQNGLKDSKQRFDSGWPPRQPSPLDDEKMAWKEEGLLPAPAVSPRRSPLSSLISFVRNALSPSPRLSSRRPSIPLTTRDRGISFPVPSLSTVRFIFLCSLWYMSSAMSSNTGKVILNLFRFPVTLTIIQFGFVALYCAILCNPFYGMTTIRSPTRAIFRSTVPMAAFQVGGHVFSSVAISRIPVSTVHTIKALSPLFTVAVYALMFGVKYSPATYVSLLPLTAGVMLACSFDVSAADMIGLISAFGSALVFVSSNIFFKKIMPSTSKSSSLSGTPSHKLDRLNLLFYSSSLAFTFMIPIWLSSDFGRLMTLYHSTSVAVEQTSTGTISKVTYYFFMNGAVHFAQNLIAFAVLASTSPVTYSIASLIKRIAVICMAVIWFNQRVHPMQGAGICMTFVGLWMYNAAKADVERGEHKMRKIEARAEIVLPVSTRESDSYQGSPVPPPWTVENGNGELKEKDASFAMSSAVPRPHYVKGHHVAHSQTIPPPINPAYNHPHGRPHPPPLSIHSREFSKPINGPFLPASGHSPTGSYPSPPLSLDSPPLPSSPERNQYFATSPSHISPLTEGPVLQSMKNRRGTFAEGAVLGTPEVAVPVVGATA